MIIEHGVAVNWTSLVHMEYKSQFLVQDQYSIIISYFITILLTNE